MGPWTRWTISAVLLVFVIAVTFDTADARRGRRVYLGPGLSSGSHHAGPVLTRDELTVCVAYENTINERSEFIETQAEKLNVIQRGIEGERLLVNATDRTAVTMFNERIAKYRFVVNLHNQEVRRQNDNVAQFNATCAGKAYYQSDMRAIRAEPPLPLSAPAPPPEDGAYWIARDHSYQSEVLGRFLGNPTPIAAQSAGGAKFIVEGPVRGHFCSGFVIKSCSIKTINAVSDGSSQPRHLPTEFPSSMVKDFEPKAGDPTRGDCTIITAKGGQGWLVGTAVDALKGTPTFLGTNKADGNLVQLGTAEYVTFKCRRS